VIAFAAFFNLFGSTVLLPIYLQTLMGYTSFLSGWVLAPGGVAAMIALPIAGKLVTKIHPKAILAFAVAISAYAIYLMSQFNLHADFSTLMWPRVGMGIGFGFLFVSLTTLTLSGIRKEEMGNASAIFNLLRNLGASCGVAFVTTLIARRAQFHQFRLADHLSPFDTSVQMVVPQISRILQERGFNPSLENKGALGLIYNRLIREASMLSFNDAFYLLSTILVVLLPLVLLMKKRREDEPKTGTS